MTFNENEKYALINALNVARNAYLADANLVSKDSSRLARAFNDQAEFAAYLIDKIEESL